MEQKLFLLLALPSEAFQGLMPLLDGTQRSLLLGQGGRGLGALSQSLLLFLSKLFFLPQKPTALRVEVGHFPGQASVRLAQQGQIHGLEFFLQGVVLLSLFRLAPQRPKLPL